MMPNARFLSKPLCVFAATFILASCAESEAERLSIREKPSYGVVESSVVVDGMKVTYQCPEVIRYSRKNDTDMDTGIYGRRRNCYVVFQPVEADLKIRFQIVRNRIFSFAKISEQSDEIVAGLPSGSSPTPPDPIRAYEEINRLYALKSGDEKRTSVEFDGVFQIRSVAGRDVDSFLSCVSYRPEGEESFPPLGTLSLKELSSTRFKLALYPTNDRFPDEWAHGFDLCNEIRVDYID